MNTNETTTVDERKSSFDRINAYYAKEHPGVTADLGKRFPNTTSTEQNDATLSSITESIKILKKEMVDIEKNIEELQSVKKSLTKKYYRELSVFIAKHTNNQWYVTTDSYDESYLYVMYDKYRIYVAMTDNFNVTIKISGIILTNPSLIFHTYETCKKFIEGFINITNDTKEVIKNQIKYFDSDGEQTSHAHRSSRVYVDNKEFNNYLLSFM